MSVVIKSGASGNVASVDSNGNLQANLPTVKTQAGYATILGEVDAGTVTGTRLLKSPYVSDDFRMAVGMDTMLLNETFNMTAQNTAKWKQVSATMTASWNNTGIVLNQSNTLTTSTGVGISSYRQATLLGSASLKLKQSVAITNGLLANQVVEFGLFPFGSGTAAPTDGVYWRISTAGIIGVINSNATETTTGVLATYASLNDNQYYQFRIIVNERTAYFFRDDILLGSIATPAANGQPFLTTTLPVSFQFRNSGTVSGSPVGQMRISDCSLSQMSLNLGKPYSHLMAATGNTAYVAQDGATMGSTALYTNSLAAGAGTSLSNTAAAITGLGGQASILPTLAAGTDGIICSYQNAAGAIGQIPKTLYITGVRISSMVTTVLAGGPVQYAYSLAFGHTAVSLATTEAVAAKAPRRIPLGLETFAAAAAVGVTGTPSGITIPFQSPVVVNPGEFIAVVGKNFGTVTTTGVITFLISFDGYFE